MTRRLSVGVLFFAIGVLLTSTAAWAERPGGREWTGGSDAYDPHTPLFLRSSAGTTWVRVHNPGNSPCDAADTAGSPTGQTIEHVWCFEGANGDSTWPAVPAAQNTGSSKETFNHWSKFAPPIPPGSKWWVTTKNTNPGAGGSFNAWCGCDSLGTNPSCNDTAFWIFKDGYGDDWNFPLTLSLNGNTGSGGTLEFDLRYDTECNYDYLYLEYQSNTTTDWTLLGDVLGAENTVFNAVSGNPDIANGGTGRACGDDLYGHSDQKDLGGNEAYYGNSIWLKDVSFPLPSENGLMVRWRGFSDGAWSDADGRGDTDGIGAIDNVTVDLASTGAGVDASDNFETGDFSGITGGSWAAGGLEGSLYDGWHLTFDPMYKNKGNTCTFSDDWMWASKPDVGAIPESGFDFFLASPVIDADGWTGGVVQYAQYICFPSEREDYSDTLVRVYDVGAGGWGLWQNIDGFITFGGCEFWNVNSTEDLTPFITATVDSLQFAWETLDVSQDGEFSWGKHGSVQHVVDNVSFGSFDGTATNFTARVIDIFADTFSLSDPAHTPFLQNAEQGMWNGIAGRTRGFANSDSLTVEITDFDGVTEANVILWWRDDAGGTGFGSWASKGMDLSIPDPTSGSDEGTYRMIIGNDAGGGEDATVAGDGLIWLAGTTVEYYVKVTDNGGNPPITFPGAFGAGTGDPFSYQVLPLGNLTPTAQRILLVDDYTRAYLDFENSTGFVPGGGAGFGTFTAATTVQPDVKVLDALDLIYSAGGADIVDKYDVQGGGSSVQCEPRGIANASLGLGGIMNDAGVPNYDAIIWLQGTFDEYSYADTTRIALGTFLDNGGKLVSTGDQVNFHLGSGGNDADSVLGFIGTYFGTSFGAGVDEMTDNRVLNVLGESGTEYDGFELGLYGECPTIRRTYDRLTLGAPATGSANRVLFRYTDGSASDNGRPAVIQNDRTAGGGKAINMGFGIETFLSRATIACFLDVALHDIFGLTDPGYACNVTDQLNGVDAPDVANGFGFSLAAARPNPFADATSIAFSVASRTHVTVEVYNILGQKVRTLVDEQMDPNSYVRDWDGRSDAGENVSSGIYFYKMIAGDFADTKKAVLLK